MSRSRSRLVRLERLLPADSHTRFGGSPRFWQFLSGGLTLADLTAGERTELEREWPAADEPDPVERAIRDMEARAKPKTGTASA